MVDEQSIWRVAQILSGYDDRTWYRLKPDRRRTYIRAAMMLLTNWQEIKSFVEVVGDEKEKSKG